MNLALGWVCSCTPVNRNPLHITLIWILIGRSSTNYSKWIELIRIELNCLIQSLYYALFYIWDVCIRCVSRSWICNFRSGIFFKCYFQWIRQNTILIFDLDIKINWIIRI